MIIDEDEIDQTFGTPCISRKLCRVTSRNLPLLSDHQNVMINAIRNKIAHLTAYTYIKPSVIYPLLTVQGSQYEIRCKHVNAYYIGFLLFTLSIDIPLK